MKKKTMSFWMIACGSAAALGVQGHKNNLETAVETSNIKINIEVNTREALSSHEGWTECVNINDNQRNCSETRDPHNS